MAYAIRFGPLGAAAATAAGLSATHSFTRESRLAPTTVQCKVQRASSMREIESESALFKSYVQRYGRNKSAQLSFQDFMEVTKPLGIKNHYIVNRIFSGVDTDQSGTVDITEVQAFCKLLAKGESTEKAKFVFRSCDLNGDGEIDKTELRNMLKNLMMSCHEVVPSYTMLKTETDVALLEDLDLSEQAQVLANRLAFEIFKVADKDKSGSIDWKEFQFWFNRRSKDVQDFMELFPFFDQLTAE